jgi:DNA-binding NtrC family response regulator
VRRLGETKPRRIDVRFVSATHRDLQTLSNTGAFRLDLYFRLAVLTVTLPPLRDRPDDIALLVQRFVPAGVASPFNEQALRALQSQPWLGNVRELRNVVEQAIALGAPAALSRRMRADGAARRIPLPPVPTDVPFKELREAWLDHLEREYIGSLLAQHGRNSSLVAQTARLDRSYVHRLMRKHDL